MEKLSSNEKGFPIVKFVVDFVVLVIAMVCFLKKPNHFLNCALVLDSLKGLDLLIISMDFMFGQKNKMVNLINHIILINPPQPRLS